MSRDRDIEEGNYRAPDPLRATGLQSMLDQEAVALVDVAETPEKVKQLRFPFAPDAAAALSEPFVEQIDPFAATDDANAQFRAAQFVALVVHPHVLDAGSWANVGARAEFEQRLG
jgi:hypothetical protein